MPRYDFRCTTCGSTKEIVQSMHDDLPELVPCGVRGCNDVAQRVYEPPAAIHFKGSGFYATDVNGAQRRRRRPNPGDDMPRSHDAAAAAIARSL